jgi:hypothetical protein
MSSHAGQDGGAQVAIFYKSQASPLEHTEAMKRRIDSPEGRKLYGRRIAPVEPVFGNLRYNKRLDRFTLRRQKKRWAMEAVLPGAQH